MALVSGPRCFYCGRRTITHSRFQPGDDPKLLATRDHVYPRASQRDFIGPRSDFWLMANSVRCCAECNGKKGELLPSEWMLLLPRGAADRLAHLLEVLGRI